MDLPEWDMDLLEWGMDLPEWDMDLQEWGMDLTDWGIDSLELGKFHPEMVFESPGMGYGSTRMGYGSPGMGYLPPRMGYGFSRMGYGSPGIGHRSPRMGNDFPGMEHGTPGMPHGFPGVEQERQNQPIKGETVEAVKAGIEIGYRHLDGALMYGNEDEVGEAIRAKIADGTVKREDIFYTSKLWMTYLSPTMVRKALEKTLKSLQLDYVDLYLMHWPTALKPSGEELFPQDASGKILHDDVDFCETWAAMECCKEAGLVRSIGVSNFNHRQLEMILKMPNLKYKPVCNQVECHPYLNQSKLLKFCKSNNIVLVGYSPLGTSRNPKWFNTSIPPLLNDPVLKKIGEKHHKTAAQIALRYQVQRGVVVIPKSFNPGRMKQNREIFDFQLTDEEMETINGINKNCRYITLETLLDHPEYPFHDEY